jgi:hypothetical protein
VSLTAELDKKDSPVTRWFNEWLTNAKPVSTEWNARVKAVPVVRPETDQRIPGTVGTAFDYRLRYYLAVTPLEDLVAATGMRLLEAGRSCTRSTHAAPDAFLKLHGPPPDAALPVADLIGEFQQAFAATLAELAPVGRSLADEQEDMLCRYCYLLGLFEELYRAGLKINSPLFALEDRATLNDLMALPPQIWIGDLCALSRLFVPYVSEIANEPLFLNPTFAGSGEIGGADADLISDGCLIDVKTTVDPKFTRTRLLYQLLGYVLLDYDDAYAIRSVGVYLARQGLLIRWQLDDLLTTLLDEKQASLAELRASFRQAVQATAVNPPRPSSRASARRSR